MEVAFFQLIFQLEGALNLNPFPGLYLKDFLEYACFRSLCTRISIGETLRKCSFEPRDESNICDASEHCLYASIFRPKRKESNVKPPRCYVVVPPSKTVYQPGDQLRFELRLISRIDLFQHFVRALDRKNMIGQRENRTRCWLTSVLVRSENGDLITIYSSADKKLLNRADKQSIEERDLHAAWKVPAEANIPQTVTLEFMSPVQIDTQVGLLSREQTRRRFTSGDPDFSLLIQAILGRVSTLAYLNGTPLKHLDYNALNQEAASVSWLPAEKNLRHREYQRPGKHKWVKGYVGRVTYQGPSLSRFLPMLRWGEWVGVGNGTTHCQGIYRIVSSNESEPSERLI